MIPLVADIVGRCFSHPEIQFYFHFSTNFDENFSQDERHKNRITSAVQLTSFLPKMLAGKMF